MAFSYRVSLDDPAGLDGQVGAALLANLTAALEDWSRHVSGQGSLDVTLRVEDTATGTMASAPTMSVVAGTTPEGLIVVRPATIHELLTGEDITGAGSDALITADPDYIARLFLDPDPGAGAPVPADRIDAVSVFRHELGHVLGMIGYFDPGGALGGAYLSQYDTFIRFDPDGSAWFIGPAAEAAHGGPVPLTTGRGAHDHYHLANELSDPLGQDLMNGVTLTYGTRYEISEIDLAILRDAGLPVTEPRGTALAGGGDGTARGQGGEGPAPSDRSLAAGAAEGGGDTVDWNDLAARAAAWYAATGQWGQPSDWA